MMFTIKKYHLRKGVIYILIASTIFAVFGLIKFNDNPILQFKLLTILVGIYLIIAVIHHTLDKTLALEIVLEYVLTAIICLTVLYGILI